MPNKSEWTVYRKFTWYFLFIPSLNDAYLKGVHKCSAAVYSGKPGNAITAVLKRYQLAYNLSLIQPVCYFFQMFYIVGQWFYKTNARTLFFFLEFQNYTV